MSANITQVLNALNDGDATAAAQLLPLVYDQLRLFAVQRMSREPAGQTIQATALVHEAYLRLVDRAEERRWTDRRHFFRAAAEAMRCILIDRARARRTLKRGGDQIRIDVDVNLLPAPGLEDDLEALSEALEKLDREEPDAAELVRLRYFAGLTITDAARAMDISPRTADRLWAYARAWLLTALRDR